MSICILSDKMNLQLPPEPVNLRQEWKKELEKGGGEMYLTRVSIKQGTEITSPLWSKYGWNEELKANGVTWRKFEEAYSYCRNNFFSWIEGSLSWDDAIKSLIREVENIEAKAKI